MTEVIKMEKNELEKQHQKNKQEIRNSVNEKGKIENQNQTHNSRREGMGPNTKRNSD